MLYREIIAVCSQIHETHKHTVCTEHYVSQCEPNCTYMKTPDLLPKRRVTVHIAAFPVSRVTMLAGESVGPDRTPHVRCVVVTEAMQWCEQIQHCLNWLPIQQHVSTGSQMCDDDVRTVWSVRSTFSGPAVVRLLHILSLS
jgi:hypothetical protein